MKKFTDLVHFSAHVGQSLGETAYLTITQEMVNLFADVTDDHQWIHTDSVRANSESPFGVPIAHGFLTLSLAPKLMAQLYRIDSVRMGINYGANRIRFTNVVPVGSRLRMKAILKTVEPQEKGIRVIMECIFELEHTSKPACIAESITLLFE